MARKKFNIKEASKKIQKELFESLRGTALSTEHSIAKIQAQKQLISLMELERDIILDTPIIDIQFIEIFSDEDGNIKTVSKVNDIEDPAKKPDNP